MPLQIGIVGLPNAGKSTLFNALTASEKAAAENFPFCTIEPNVGRAILRDERLPKIAAAAKTEKIIYESVEFVDIAGLVAGASKGEGLGNKFLANIRETDAVLLVLRFFVDDKILHNLETVDPARDKEILETELILKDLETVEKSLAKIQKESKSGDKEKLAQKDFLENLLKNLAAGKKANFVEIPADEKLKKFFKNLNLLTAKPFIFAANLAETEVANFDENAAREILKLNSDEKVLPISAKIESEIALLSDDEKTEFLADLNLTKSGLEILADAARAILNLESYFTAGEKEARAWLFEKNSFAPAAAGKIHTDFEKGFICADKVFWEDFVKFDGWNFSRENGKVETVGKSYAVRDGDVLLFKFSN